MKQTRYAEEQIAHALQRAKARTPVANRQQQPAQSASS
jgi:hypothetical protein